MIDKKTRDQWREDAAYVIAYPDSTKSTTGQEFAERIVVLLDEVERLEAKHGMRAYQFPKYENQPEQLDKNTATTWAVHLNVRPSQLHAVLERFADLRKTDNRITGEYGYGDSFTEWGEQPKGPDDVHLTVYFVAPREQAYQMGFNLSTHAVFAVRGMAAGGPLGDRHLPSIDFHVSTAGDFAEQLEPVHE